MWESSSILQHSILKLIFRLNPRQRVTSTEIGVITQTVSLSLDSAVKSKECVTAEWFINTHI